MSDTSVITGPNVGIDALVSGLIVACPTLTSIISGASSQDQAALAAELAAIADATPGPVVAEELELDTGIKTATAVAGAATLNKSSGIVTTEALTTAAGADYTLTLTNSKIAAGDIVLATVQDGTDTAGTPAITTAASGTGSATIIVQNVHATAAFNGTLKIGFAVFKAGAPT